MLEIELYVSFENRGLNIWIVAIDNRHIGVETFDGFGVDNFFNIKKIFKAIISKKSEILENIGRVLDSSAFNNLMRCTLLRVEMKGKRVENFSASVTMPGGGACLREGLLSFVFFRIGAIGILIEKR